MIDAKPEWHRDFFRGPVLDVVRNLFPAHLTASEVEFIAHRLAQGLGTCGEEKAPRLAAGSKILDVPCGAGRHALGLAALGYDVTGVDLSPELVSDCRSAAQSRGLSATFEVRDMRDLPWKNRFDGAYCFGNSFAYMDDDGNAAFLAAVQQAVRPGGAFLLQTNLAAESVLANPIRRTWYPFGDVTMLHDARYDPASGTLTSEYGLVCNGRIDRRTAHYRIYLYRELVELCRQAGFSVADSWGSLTGDAFGPGSPGLFLLCTK